jgi:hypothetical protein
MNWFLKDRRLRAPEDDNGADAGDYDEVDEIEAEDEGVEDDAAVEGDDEEEPDQGEDDDVGADEGQEERPAQVAAKSRAQARVEAATKAAKEAKAEAEALRREMQGLMAERQRTQQQETQSQRAERLAQMGEAERLEYLLNEQGQNFQARLNAIQFEAQDSADRTAFEGLCSRNPTAASLKDEVESQLRQLRAAGTTAPRETVLKYLIGERALSRAPRAKAKAERSAAANRQRQSARPGSARSDVSTGRPRGDEAAQRRARLEDVNI